MPVNLVEHLALDEIQWPMPTMQRLSICKEERETNEMK
jgi:hypothetical protein